MDDLAQRVDGLGMDQDLELDHVGLAIADGLVVERRIALGDRLQAIVEIDDHLSERKLVLDEHACRRQILDAHIDSAALLDEVEDRLLVLDRQNDREQNIGLFDRFDVPVSGKLGRIVDDDPLIVVGLHAVDDVRRCHDQVEVELARQTLLDDVHVQQAEEAEAIAEAKRLRGVGRVVE